MALRCHQILETPPDPAWCIPSVTLALPVPIMSRRGLSCLPSTSSKETKGWGTGWYDTLCPSLPGPPGWREESAATLGERNFPSLPSSLHWPRVCLSLCQHSVRLFLVPRFWEALAGSGSDLLLPPSPQAPRQVPHAFQQPNEDRDACVCLS